MYKDKRRKILMDTFTGMIARCEKKDSGSYKSYGAKGIKVCDRWRNSFDAFVSDMGFRPDGTTLDRIDGSGDYSPENCRWATMDEQVANKKTTILLSIDGETKPIAAWCRKFGVSPQAAHHRIRKLGLDPVWSVSTPASRKTRHGIKWSEILK